MNSGASAGPAKGASAHGPSCTLGADGGPCVRCIGFQPGNELGRGHGRPVEHGAYSRLLLTPRAAEIAQWIRELADHLSTADEPAVQTLSMMLAQLERWGGVLHEIDEATLRGEDLDAWLGLLERRASLSKDARGWANAARSLMNDLALTPSGRAQFEERTLTVIHVHEVRDAFIRWFHIAGRFVPFDRREEFFAAIKAELEERDVGVRELPPVESIDTDAVESQP